MFSFAIARRQLSVFLVFKSSKWVVNCSKQSQKVLENQEFPGFDSVLPWHTNSILTIFFPFPEKNSGMIAVYHTGVYFAISTFLLGRFIGFSGILSAAGAMMSARLPDFRFAPVRSPAFSGVRGQNSRWHGCRRLRDCRRPPGPGNRARR